ncbi:MAG: hypothetical protein KBS62_05020 [Oscillospiraceae bacterium]|nr:hypothetical protein [Candidatus Ruminococcus equi]
MENKNRTNKKAALISLCISVVVLAVVTAAALIYENIMNVKFDITGMIIADVIGFLIIFAIVYHFEKPPKE